jgi:hypothetical protein
MFNPIQNHAQRGMRVVSVAALLALLASPSAAQQSTPDSTRTKPATSSSQLQGAEGTSRAKPQLIVIDNLRPHDMRGVNMFEPPKASNVPYTGFQLQWGAGFTQQFQDLSHENTATPVIVAGVNKNQLADIGAGFNNAEANLFMDAQLAQGIRLALTSYLSTRHHNETWVKDGYILIDGSPWENQTLDNLMKILTLRVGHFEINYGDMHFRRSDGGQTMFNPLVGNLIMDAFTTEVGGELYARKGPWLGMFGITGGEIRGTVTAPEKRAPSYLGKLGFDRQLKPELRVRLTGSVYSTAKSINNTLYSGSRTGSRYFWVMENTTATETGNAWSGDLQPGMSSKITSWVVNPFIKLKGLEAFGNIEQAKGRSAVETSDRTWNQNAGDVVYRFAHDQFYVAARYNTAKGALVGIPNDVSIDRTEAGGGWFLTPNIEMKGEYVQQNYHDFPTTDIRNGGKFHGVMVEGVVQF